MPAQTGAGPGAGPHPTAPAQPLSSPSSAASSARVRREARAAPKTDAPPTDPRPTEAPPPRMGRPRLRRRGRPPRRRSSTRTLGEREAPYCGDAHFAERFWMGSAKRELSRSERGEETRRRSTRHNPNCGRGLSSRRLRSICLECRRSGIGICNCDVVLGVMLFHARLRYGKCDFLPLASPLPHSGPSFESSDPGAREDPHRLAPRAIRIRACFVWTLAHCRK